MDLCLLAFGNSLGVFISATVFFPLLFLRIFCSCGFSFLCGDLERPLTRLSGSSIADPSFWNCCSLGGGATGWGWWLARGGPYGGARSRDLDLCFLPERPLCSTDGDSPAVCDVGLTLDDHRFEFVVPVVFVREGVLDHANWTVAVVSHPVVAHHHRQN